MASHPQGIVGRVTGDFTALCIYLGILGLLGTTLAGMAGRWWWVADLFAHYRVYYAILLAVVVAIAMLRRQWRWVLVGLIGLTINLVAIVPLYISPRASGDSDPARQLRLAQVNVRFSNHDGQAVRAFLHQCEADVVFIQEMTPAWVARLDDASLPFEVRLADPRTHAFGIGMLVRKDLPAHIAIESVRVLDLAGQVTDRPCIEATVRVGRQTVTILSIHPPPPVGRDATALRNRMLQAAADWARDAPRPHVVIGDLNTTPWSGSFGLLTKRGMLVNSQRGYGNQGTWPVDGRFPILLPIDHCLHSDDLVTVERRVGPAIGSDHLPLLVTLAPAL